MSSHTNFTRSRVLAASAWFLLLAGPGWSSILQLDSGNFDYLTSTYNLDNYYASGGPSISKSMGGGGSFADFRFAGSDLEVLYTGSATASYGSLKAQISTTERGN